MEGGSTGNAGAVSSESWNPGFKETLNKHSFSLFVIPAKAGIQWF